MCICLETVVTEFLWIHYVAFVNRDNKERYRTLAMYKIPVPVQELTLVEKIEEQWRELFIQAKNVDRSLIKVKKKFTLV